MSDGEEWGPWIEHDGKGCPCVGETVHVIFDKPFVEPMDAGIIANGPGWTIRRHVRGIGISWHAHACVRIIRYRIRKPRGLTILQNLIADLPAPVAPKVTA